MLERDSISTRIYPRVFEYIYTTLPQRRDRHKFEASIYIQGQVPQAEESSDEKYSSEWLGELLSHNERSQRLQEIPRW